MIITHISAENLLKYRQLELSGLPHQGLITISGQNESGKSTIGETVCFALFGRTFSIGDGDVKRVIRWGETSCSVHLGFAVAGSQYEIARFLDTDGNHGARLFRTGEEDHPIARGVNNVNEALQELLGYQFDEFVESFYLAQREITTPHPHSHAIKTMAGIAALEQVAGDLAQDIENEQRKIPDLAEQIEMVEVDVDTLAIEPDHMGELESRHESIVEAGRLLHARETDLGQATDEYIDALPRIRSAKRIKRLTGLIAFISLIAVLVTGGTWYLLDRLPESRYTVQLLDLLEQNLPAWNEQVIRHLDMGLGVSACIFLFFWLITMVQGRKVSRLKKHGDTLASQVLSVQDPIAGLDDRVLAMVASMENEASAEEKENEQSVSEVTGEDISEEIDEERPSEEPTLEADLDVNTSHQVAPAELAAIRKCAYDQDGIRSLLAETRQQLLEELEKQQTIQARLESLISHEQDRLAKADALTGVITNLKDRMSEHRRNIQLREIADELINAATRHISQRFNKDLRELASSTLPLLTEGRYEHLHINGDLNVRAFSSEKHDFMDLDEISSGTQRQIMLAVRLALSQELVNTTIGGDQFIFLDEPFAFFDETRTRNAMTILPTLSDEICQVWVIAQEFPEDTQSNLAIACSREHDHLTIAGA